MKVGYARVSTDDQNLSLHRQALEAAGCEIVFEDAGMSGAARHRPGLSDALSKLRPDDVLVVWRLDRLGRSLAHLIEIIDGLGRAGTGFQSLSDSIDTTSAGGRLIFHVAGAFAEFERGLISERTRAGMKAAKCRGVHVGRPRKLTMQQRDHARALLEVGEQSRAAIAALFGVEVKTLRRALSQPRNV